MGGIRKSTNFVAISNFAEILSKRDLFSFIEICGFIYDKAWQSHMKKWIEIFFNLDDRSLYKFKNSKIKSFVNKDALFIFENKQCIIIESTCDLLLFYSSI